jgi:DNA polymerase-3 subunit beta
MNASIEAHDLKAAIGACMGVAVRHSGVPALKSVRLVIGNGLARFEATSMDQSVIVETSAEGELEALLDTQMVADRAQVLAKGPLSLSQAQGMVTLAQNKAKWRIPEVVNDGAWPAALFEQLAGDDKEVVSGSAFIDAIERAAYAAEPLGTDRYAIQGVNLDPEGFAIGVDGKRFSIVPCPTKLNATIPSAGVAMLRKLFKDAGEVRIAKDERWIEFTSDGLTYRTKMTEHDFPEWRKLMPKDEGKKGFASVALLTEALSRVSAYTLDKGKAPRVRISTSGKLMRLVGSNQGEENTDEVGWEGDEMELTLHPGFALEALNSMSSEAVEISYHPGQHHTLFTPDGSDGFRVVMAMRG